jgi:hypothetical protein
MWRVLKILLLLVLFAGLHQVSAQNPNNALLYSYQSTLFSERGAASDPVSIIMPGTAYNAGLGSFLDNPASMALFDKSFMDFGFNYRMVEEDAVYLGQSRLLDDNQGGLSNVGFLYKYPTLRGSFVMGAGYTQHSVYNRSMGFRSRNENSTITDKFKIDGSPYQTIAFNTFAIDYGDEFEDWDESIFRVGFDRYGDFLGIRQQGEILQRGHSGEYSMFVATEFQENLMIGASIGITSGRFVYDRIFQEVDEFNDYDGNFIDSSGDGVGDTDIDNIVLEDRARSTFTNFTARAGFLYRITEFLNVGGSFELGSRLNVEEDFDANIITTFNNNTEFEDSDATEFSYRVSSPSRTSLGVALDGLNGFSASVAVDYTDYSKTKIDFRSGSLFEDELIENDFIAENFRSVWSFRSGISYDISPELTVRGGYSHIPSRYRDGDDNKNIFGFGAGISVSNNVRFEFAGQYTIWDEVSAVYDYARYDYSPLPDNLPNFSFQSEVADRSVERWNILGTLKVKF